MMVKRALVCPICGAPAAPAFSPFCRQGCRDRDLLKWLDDGYRLPAGRGDPETEDGLDSEGPRD